MTTIKSTTSQLIEALRKAQETVNETRNQLEKTQPHPRIGDIWKDVYGEPVIVISTSPDTRILSIEIGDWVSIDCKDLCLNYERVGTVKDLTFHPEPIEMDGDLTEENKHKNSPKFRPFDKQDWSMFGGARCFNARKGSTAELITPHIKELDWALVIVDKSGINIYPSCDLTNGDPEYWMVNWKEVNLPHIIEIDQMDARDALEVYESLTYEINSYMDLKQQDVFRKVS